MERLFLPGWGLAGKMYEPGLPADWQALEPPGFRLGRDYAFYRRWLAQEIDQRGGHVWLAGHSMGAALAVTAATDAPSQVSRLTLLAPAGLPLRRSLIADGVDFVREFVDGQWGRTMMLRRGLGVLSAAPASLILGRELDGLDLTEELLELRSHAVKVEVIGCHDDKMMPHVLCRELATLAGGDYREVSCRGGHLWPLVSPDDLRDVLSV